MKQFFVRDAEFSVFLQADVGRITRPIKDIRNDTAHAETYSPADAQKMRTTLLETQNQQGKSLLEWGVKILEYYKKRAP